MRSGRSRNSQPEKARRHLPSALLRTSSCTKAPVSCTFSHGALVSQACSRTMASPTLMASPGFRVRSRVRPLRLLSRPMTALRSAIGVPGRLVASLDRIGVLCTLTGPVSFATGTSPSLQAASASSEALIRIDGARPAARQIMMRRGSTPHNRRSPSGAGHPFRARRTGDRR